VRYSITRYGGENAGKIFQEATGRHTGFELGMEGKGLIDITLDMGIACIRTGYPVTLALTHI
jgi:hypothetical protein